MPVMVVPEAYPVMCMPRTCPNMLPLLLVVALVSRLMVLPSMVCTPVPVEDMACSSWVAFPDAKSVDAELQRILLAVALLPKTLSCMVKLPATAVFNTP